MDGPLYSVYRAQVTGVHAASGTISVAFMLGGNSIPLPHVLIAGNPATGIHWLPAPGDFVLLAYEPGMVPVIIGPYIDASQAALITPPLAAGEVRLGAAVTVDGNALIGADPTIHSGAPGSTTNYMRVTLDGGATWFRIALVAE